MCVLEAGGSVCVYWRPGVVWVCILEAGGSVCTGGRGVVCVYWRPGG